MEAYRRFILTLMVWITTAIAAVGGVILFFAVMDQLSISHFGYPLSAVFGCFGIIAIALFVRQIGVVYLRRAKVLDPSK
jgi:hypothetical protein